MKNTSIRPPGPGDRVVGVFAANTGDDIGGGGFGDLYDSFPSRPGMDLLRINVDDQYSPTYIAEVKQKVSPLVRQSITYIETYGFTEIDGTALSLL